MLRPKSGLRNSFHCKPIHSSVQIGFATWEAINRVVGRYVSHPPSHFVTFGSTFGLSFQSEGSTQRQEEFSSICKGYQFRVSHYAYTQVLTRIFGLSDWNGKTGGNPTCCRSVCGISRTYSHCQSESKV